jgi:hypothetical protein
MDKKSLLDIIKAYITTEEESIGYTLTKTKRNQWIIEDALDELILINEEYRSIDNDDADAKRIFRNKSIDVYETDNFKKYLKNKSDINSLHYNKLLKSCVISADTIEDFFRTNRDSNPKTIDFFTAFCRYQERENGTDLLGETSKLKGRQTTPTIKTPIQIHGATIINEEFINTVKSGKTFTMPEFYGAKQNNNCQWYGIINDFDVIRIGYDKLKETVLNSFSEEKDGKVSAIVHGTGGSGKSTVLRRIAIDFHAESFDVVWLEKGKVEEFVEKGLFAIKKEVEKDKNRKFLIVIEDWYRMFDDEYKARLGVKILEETYTTNNTRIVIGDRNIGNSYKNYRNNDFELLLSPEDNKIIIKKIVEKYPNWEIISGKLFEKEKVNQSSLFLLLFILSRLDQNEYGQNSFNLSQPQQVFLNIIESDLRYISKKYIGLAKALYYLGCIYANYKIFISYNTFLKLADFYNEKNNDEISDLFSRWNIKDDVFDKLKIYINKNHSLDKFKTSDLIQFNHDILADIGISKLSFDDWDKFGDKIKIQLLKTIIEKGDDYSSSKFLGAMLLFEKQIFKNLEEKLFFIKRLIENNNKETYYLYALTQLKLDNEALTEFAHSLWDRKIDYPVFWGIYFHKFKSTEIIKNQILEILNINSFSKYHPIFINSVLRYTEDIETRNLFVHELLSNDNYKIIEPQILSIALSYANNEDRQKFVVRILQDYNWVLSNITNDILNDLKANSYSLILGCMEYAKQSTLEDFSNVALQNYEWKNIDTLILTECLKHSSIEIKNIFLKNILNAKSWKEFKDFSSILHCLINVSDKEKEMFFKKVLLDDDYEIIKKFFYQCRKFKDENISKLFIKTAIKNKEGKYTDVVRNILFIEGIGLEGYLSR